LDDTSRKKFEECEVRKDYKVSLTEMHENSDLKNGIKIQMDEFDLEMMEEAAKEVAAREPESPQKEGLG
jgi:hypothetical protein